MSIKILTITTTGLNNQDGISTILYDYYSRFERSDFELYIVADGTYKKDIIQKFEDINVNIRYLPSRKQKVIQYMFSLWNLMCREKYDIIYVHGSSAIMAIELFVGIIVGCKVRVVHSHNTSCDHKKADKRLRPFFNMIYTDAFACGQAAGDWMFEKRNFTIMPNGRDLKKYSFDLVKRNKMRKVLELEEDCLAIGHVGNFTPQKNHKFIIDTFSELVKLRPKSQLYLMGGGKSIDFFKEYAAEKNILNQIIFTGPNDNVPDMLQAMDVMMLPSLHEGLPLVTIEWQICALPIIMSDFITTECIFTNLVECMDLGAGAKIWAKKINDIELLNRDEIKEEVLKEAQAAGFDIDINAIRLQDILKDRSNSIRKQGR